MFYRTIYDATIGPISINGTAEYISHVDFSAAGHSVAHRPARKGSIPMIDEAVRQLEAYLAGNLQVFSLPLALQGSAFQHSVWQALCTIPYGETRSYGDIAAYIHKPKAARAVGLANNKNPISIIVPCHRVIGANGQLVGYGGGLGIKEYLLNLEARHT